MGKRLANKANREDVAEHYPDPRVRKAIEVDVALIDHYDQLRGAGELALTRAAKTDDVQTFARLQAVAGIGQILALVILYEILDIRRFPRVQNFVSYCRNEGTAGFLGRGFCGLFCENARTWTLYGCVVQPRG